MGAAVKYRYRHPLDSIFHHTSGVMTFWLGLQWANDPSDAAFSWRIALQAFICWWFRPRPIKED